MLRHLLIAATMAVSAPATASQLYLFNQYGTNARGFVSDGLISDTDRIDFDAGQAPICVGTPDCGFRINGTGQSIPDVVSINNYYAYFQGGAFSNQGVYSSVLGLIPTTLINIALPVYSRGSYIYLFTQYGTNVRGFVSDHLISDTDRIDFNSGQAPICVGTPDCGFRINGTGQSIPDVVSINNYYAYFQGGAFSNQGVYSSVLGLIPTTLSVIALPDQFAAAPPVPEPATWAMMLVGFGGMGIALRRRRNVTTAART